MGLVWFSPMNLPFGEFNWEEPLLNHIKCGRAWSPRLSPGAPL